MRMEPTCLDRLELEASVLFGQHAPRFVHRNKAAVFEKVCPSGTEHHGLVRYSRWAPAPLPTTFPSELPDVTTKPGFFDYPSPRPGWIDWHVNFADPRLFGAYAGPLLAQDELQVLEHPGLGAIREALIARGMPAVTGEADRPTPVLVSGVERRCAFDTAPRPDRGRPLGLYGNHFARAATRDVLDAVRVLSPPTVSHVLAIAAPFGGRGAYTAEQIRGILRTATTGFAAARIESASIAPGARVCVRTGFWGCGAFGGHRVLMTALQFAAAQLAGIDALAFYVSDGQGQTAVEHALTLRPTGLGVEEYVAGLVAQRFAWGVSDGN